MENQLQEITQIKMEKNKVVIMNPVRIRDVKDRARKAGTYTTLLKNRTHTHTVFRVLHYGLRHQATFTEHLLCGGTWARCSV